MGGKYMSPRRVYPPIILYCIHCRAKLGTLAMEDQLKDGRIICAYCRKAERGQAYLNNLPTNWLDVAALVGMGLLAWAALYFL